MMDISQTIALIWAASTLATLIALIPILIWAIKSRQFSRQDHARFLPLSSGQPKTEPSPEPAQGGQRDVLS